MFTSNHLLVEQGRAQRQALLKEAQHERLLATLAEADQQPKFGYRVGELLVQTGEWLKTRNRLPATPWSLADG